MKKNINKILVINIFILFGILCIVLDVLHAEQIPQLLNNMLCTEWQSGQKLFYSDPYWRGGDCASSVDLGDGRILWLFADSYIATQAPYKRDHGSVKMIRNCLGIQNNSNPSTANLSVFYRGTDEDPDDYFTSTDSVWYWPGNAVRIDSSLIVFLMRIHSIDSGLGFDECNDIPHAAFLIKTFKGNPVDWQLTPIDLSDNKFNTLLGAATLVDNSYLCAFSVTDDERRLVFLARWHCDIIKSGNGLDIEWWTGDSTKWQKEAEISSEPKALFDYGTSEFSVVYDSMSQQYISIQIVGFGKAKIMMRTAPELTGPWSDLQIVYSPPENKNNDIMIYAVKIHPGILGADLLITYNINSSLEKIIADSTLYYPKLLRLNWNVN